MTPEAALNGLTSFLHDELGLSVAFGMKVLDDFDFARISLSLDVAKRVQVDAIKWVQSLKDCELIPYEVGYSQQETEVIYLETESIPDGELLFKAVDPITSIPTYDGDGDFLDGVSITSVALIDSVGRQATLLRRVTKSFLLSRTGRRIKLVFNEGVFNELREEVVFLDDRFDCVFWDNYLFVRSKDQFERIFDYQHLKIDHAEATLTAVTHDLPMADPDLFVGTMASDRRYHKKIASVVRRGLFRNVPIGEIERLAIERGLAVQFETDSQGQRVIAFDPSPSGRRALMSLLDDDHVVSELTARKYEATSKMEWKGTQ